MSHATPTTTSSQLRDWVTALLRTGVPALWGAVITWLLGSYVLPEELVALLTSEAWVAAITSLVIAAWYALWRILEPHVPTWLVRIVLGSALTPTYSGTVATLPAATQADLASLAGALDEGDPARLALEQLGVTPAATVATSLDPD